MPFGCVLSQLNYPSDLQEQVHLVGHFIRYDPGFRAQLPSTVELLAGCLRSPTLRKWEARSGRANHGVRTHEEQTMASAIGYPSPLQRN